MKADRIVFLVVMLAGLPALAYSVGIERGQVVAAKVCPEAQQRERLVYSEQRAGVTFCNYAAEPHGHGMAKLKRAAS